MNWDTVSYILGEKIQERSLNSVSELINNEPIREQVFKKLRMMILNYELKPGDKVIEGDIAKQFEVSRTPIREALHRLEEEGLITIYPRRFCLVNGITIDSIHEINLIRANLEPLTAIIATEKLTDKDLNNMSNILKEANLAFKNHDIELLINLNDDFHNVIIKSAELPRITKLLENLQDYFMLFRQSYMKNKDLAQRTLLEHEEILKALKSRDKDLVEKVYKNHVNGILEYEYIAVNDDHRNIDIQRKENNHDK